MNFPWPEIRIAEACNLIVDCVNKTAPQVPGPTPYKMIRTPNVKNGRINLSDCRYVDEEIFEKWTRRAKLEKGDVILTREAPIGEVGYVDFEDTVFLGQRLMQYRPNLEILDDRFLLYAFLSPYLQHQFGTHEGSGSVVSHIRVGDCSEFRIPLPSLAEQKGIANVLGALDDKIQLNRQTARTLEELAQRLFKSWFVDFDPVRANMAGRQPAHTPAEIADLFPDRLVDSPLGPIPEGWVIQSFHSAFDIISGGTPKTKIEEYWNGDIPWYSVADFPPNELAVVIETEKHITRDGLDNSAAKLVPEFTTILSARGTVGKVALSGCEMTFNQSCYGVRGIHGDHFRAYFQTKHLVEQLQSRAHGSVFSTITRETLRSIDVAQPPLDLSTAFERHLEPFILRGCALALENQTLAQLRDRLLPKLISGQIRVPDAREMAEESVS